MNAWKLKPEYEAELQIFEPAEGELAHITEFDTFEDRLQAALDDYEEAQEAYLHTDAGSRDLDDAIKLAEEAGKELISRALCLFHMYPLTTENRNWANRIIDRVTKDASCRERTSEQYYRKMRELNPGNPKLHCKLLKQKQKHMNFLNRCMRTQSHYLQRSDKLDAGYKPLEEAETRSAAKYERIRKLIPAGHVFRAPRIFPHERIPLGQRVPTLPKVYQKFNKVEPEEKVFDKEHNNFTLPKDYLSPDGLIDGESIVWDYENRKVTMKFRGGIPVTWDFWLPRNDRDVLRPGDWCAEYQQRLWAQVLDDYKKGVFIHRSCDDPIQDYDRIPNENK